MSPFIWLGISGLVGLLLTAYLSTRFRRGRVYRRYHAAVGLVSLLLISIHGLLGVINNWERLFSLPGFAYLGIMALLGLWVAVAVILTSNLAKKRTLRKYHGRIARATVMLALAHGILALLRVLF